MWIASRKPFRKMMPRMASNSRVMPIWLRKGVGRVGIVNEVRRSVCRREGHGDDKVGGRKAQQHQHKHFAAPAGKQILQHGDAALAVGAGAGHPLIDRQCAKQRDQHKNEGGNGRKNAGGEKCDAGLVAQSGKVVDPG